MKTNAVRVLGGCWALWAFGFEFAAADEHVDPETVRSTMKRATAYFVDEVATHGGYVYFYSTDLTQRWGEGVASADQIWVQPPGTPTVGLAFVRASESTGDADYRNAAVAAARALVYGQLKSGGWTNCIDFNPHGDRVAEYRNGHGRGKNNSSLDDGQTQSAILLLIRTDEILKFQDAEIHQCALSALDALLDAQFPNGAFPQVWTKPVSEPPVLAASYPDYDWRTKGRVKEYWTMYTLNDNVCGYVAETLMAAHRIYGDQRYLQALRKLGDFLILAQMPEPQRGWAQQYNFQMHPIWARRFEPAAVSGDETQEVIETLIKIAAATNDNRYVKPVPAALAYLKRSLLADGRLARYYELQTNRPLYMFRKGRDYFLTYDDGDLPAHYGWKWESRIDQLDADLQYFVRTGTIRPPASVSASDVKQIVRQQDSRGRWVSTYNGERLVGQARMKKGAEYLSSERFSRNLTKLARFMAPGTTP